MSANWYLYQDHQQQGPFTWEELYQQAAAGAVKPADYVWTEGMTEWIQADQVEGLLTTAPTASFNQQGSSTATQAPPTRKRGRGCIIALCIVLVVFLLGGGLITYHLLYAGREAEGPEELQAELPEVAWVAVASDFRFHPELTELVRDMSTDLFASHPDVQWWVFSYPGTVDAAYAHLFVPPDAVATPPHEVSIADILHLHLLLWEDEIAEVRGSAWLDEAHSQSLAWQDKHQRLGSVSYTREQDVNAAEDNVDPYVTWSFVVASPIVDLSDLNLIEGTFLVIMRFQYIID